MKRFIQLGILLAAWFAAGGMLFAQQDLIVEENGVLPNYATISDAVAAASSGDRIFIKNKAGNVPYNENVTIDKSIELLPFAQDSFFIVIGQYTINPGVGRVVTIIGMHNQIGSITAAVNGPAGNPTRVNVLGCHLLSGSIAISGTNYVSHISGNDLDAGSITARYCTITGNNLGDGQITVNPAPQLASEDTLYIVGNRQNGTSAYLWWSNPNHYYNISNNFVNSTYSVGIIRVNSIKSGAGMNRMDNNSIISNGSSREGYYYSIAVPSGAQVEMNNNAFQSISGSSVTAFYTTGVSAGGFGGIYYNIWRNASPGIAGAGWGTAGNITSSTLSLNSTTGECVSADCVDSGNPSTDHTDLDLSRNNMGVAGGSFNFNNFFPILTGGARVYLVKTPRTVVQTSTIRAEADSYDR